VIKRTAVVACSCCRALVRPLHYDYSDGEPAWRAATRTLRGTLTTLARRCRTANITRWPLGFRPRALHALDEPRHLSPDRRGPREHRPPWRKRACRHPPNGENDVFTCLRSYFGGMSDATARATVDLPIPSCRAICRCGILSAAAAAGSAPNLPLRSPSQSVWTVSFSPGAMASISSGCRQTGC
jgi:hypothetical protein